MSYDVPHAGAKCGRGGGVSQWFDPMIVGVLRLMTCAAAACG